jgi:hypothetical protein
MKTPKKQYLIKILQEHVTKISELKYPQIREAEALLQRTRILAINNFPEKPLFLNCLDQIRFRSKKFNIDPNAPLWEESIGKLWGIAQSMLDEIPMQGELQQNKTLPRLFSRNLIITIIILTLSLILWTFELFVHIPFVSNHPKKTSLFLTVQLLFLLMGYLCIVYNKKNKSYEIAGLLSAVILAVIALL